MATFQDKLALGWAAEKFLCVGLDPRPEMIPLGFAPESPPTDRLYLFCCAIAQYTRPYALAFKPNIAFFQRFGLEGIKALESLCSWLHSVCPDAVIILDAKYGDIGDTNEACAEFAFDVLGVDAVTLNPYVGGKAHHPFLCRDGKGCIFLVKTSNPGAAELQDRDVIVEGEEFARVRRTPTAGMLRLHNGVQMLTVHQLIAHMIANEWNERGNCGVVVGATYPGDLSTVRTIIGDKVPILIPGIGAQGGDLRGTVNESMGTDGKGMMISASRSIIHASTGEDFAEAAEHEARRLHELILAYRG